MYFQWMTLFEDNPSDTFDFGYATFHFEGDTF